MIQREFYLSSHDFGSVALPRKCEVLHKVEGLQVDSKYLLVKITPTLSTKLWDGPTMEFDQVILAISGDREAEDIETKPVMADIVLCPAYSGGLLDEKQCSKIGVGRLHATYAEALEASPV